jgi:hypothetical protein
MMNFSIKLAPTWTSEIIARGWKFRPIQMVAGVPRDMRAELCGHADGSAGAGYVHGGSIEAMKEATEKLTFDGFAFARLAATTGRYGILPEGILREDVKMIEALAFPGLALTSPS